MGMLIKNKINYSGCNTPTAVGTLKPWLYKLNEEIVIGIYNGKPLYRKLISITPSTSIGHLSYSHSIANVEHIHINVGSSYIDWTTSDNTSTTTYLSIPNAALDVNSTVAFINANPTDIIIYQGVDRSSSMRYIVCLEYTKTTDSAGSGNSLMPYSNALPAATNYNTVEQVVGTWIDGKPLYQRTFVWTGRYYGNTQLSTGLINIDTIFEKEAFASFDNGNIQPLPYVHSTTSYLIGFFVRTNEVGLRFGNSYDSTNYASKITATLLYTKTS